MDHDGPHFRVAGPHLAKPTVQRTLVLYLASSSSTGWAFAARPAEVVFVGGSTL